MAPNVSGGGTAESEAIKVEFFFDFSSPWTYLAFRRFRALMLDIQSLKPAMAVEFHLRPVLVGAVFNAVNPSVYEMRKAPVIAKAIYTVKDMQEWAEAYGMKVRSPYGEDPPDVFPVNSAKALRGGFFAQSHGRFMEYAELVFSTYWSEGRDISDMEVLKDIAHRAGLDDVDAFAAACVADDAKQQLKQNTQDLIDRGGFGSPTMFLNGDTMFFGNDRIVLLERRLLQMTHNIGKSLPGYGRWTAQSML